MQLSFYRSSKNTFLKRVLTGDQLKGLIFCVSIHTLGDSTDLFPVIILLYNAIIGDKFYGFGVLNHSTQ
jgi:hypothetical protein